jgi:hypothetical protein
VSKHTSSAVVGAAIVTALLVFVGAIITVTLDEAASPAVKDPAVPEFAVDSSDRPAYPYSVVSGGVYDRQEVVREMQRDPVVASHYSAIDSGALRRATLPRTSLRYVSFRKEGKVYWTRRPVTIPKGEPLLSSGASEIRARCGNRLAEKPQRPTLPYNVPEPTDTEMGTVVPRGPNFFVPAPGAEPVVPDEAPRREARQTPLPSTLVPPSALTAGHGLSHAGVFAHGYAGLQLVLRQPSSEIPAMREPLAPEALRAEPLELRPRIDVTTSVWPPLLAAGVVSPEFERQEGSAPSTAQNNASQRSSPSAPREAGLPLRLSAATAPKTVTAPTMPPGFPTVSEFNALDRVQNETPDIPPVPVPESASFVLALMALTSAMALARVHSRK